MLYPIHGQNTRSWRTPAIASIEVNADHISAVQFNVTPVTKYGTKYGTVCTAQCRAALECAELSTLPDAPNLRQKRKRLYTRIALDVHTIYTTREAPSDGSQSLLSAYHRFIAPLGWPHTNLSARKCLQCAASQSIASHATPCHQSYIHIDPLTP
jgi:hypothetical protein